MTPSSEALEDLRAALTRRGNVKLLNLLLRAEGKLARDAIVTKRRTIHGTTYEPLSASGYWRSDGSMRCPFEELFGHVACDFHTYSGCSNDPDDPEETRRLRAAAEDAAREDARWLAENTCVEAASAPKRP